MEIINQDILTDIYNPNRVNNIVILHGCNCFHIMGGGIAAYLRKKYPEIYVADKKTALGDPAKLGTFSCTTVATIQNRDIRFIDIVNCYTQFGLGDRNNKTPVEYGAIRSCLQKVRLHYSGWEIRMPKIGCGLAGGDWSVVERIFNDELIGLDATVYDI